MLVLLTLRIRILVSNLEKNAFNFAVLICYAGSKLVHVDAKKLTLFTNSLVYKRMSLVLASKTDRK